MQGREPILGSLQIFVTCCAFGNIAISLWREHPGVWGALGALSYAIVAVCVCRSIYRDRVA